MSENPICTHLDQIKVTELPETGLPYWSLISTDGAVATFVFTVADWLLPETKDIPAAGPASAVAAMP